MGHASRIVLLVTGLVIGSSCATLRHEERLAFTVAERGFDSSGVTILVDVYTPTLVDASLRETRKDASDVPNHFCARHQFRAARSKASTGSPPVLVLHGAGGMLFDGPEMSRVAQRLAAAGYEVYQVHYFNRTQTWFARQAVLLKLFPAWLATVQDAAAWVRSIRPDAPAIGIFGYSLGAFAAIETARRDATIGAVVEQAGGFWHGHPEGPTRQPLPPILLIHGLDDQRVPFEKYTQPLESFLRKHADPFATQYFPGEGHQFSAAASRKVREQAVEFFARHLPKSRR
jgi:dienelactone hydrolase